MPTMNVSLPEGLKEIVEARIASGRYASASDYVRDLIRQDEESARKRDEIQQLVDEGRESGMSERSFREIIAAARTQALRRGAPD